MLSFTIPGKPQGKARARTFYSNTAKKIVSTTPENTVLYENLIKITAKQAMINSGCQGWHDKQPVHMYISIYYEIPKSANKKDKALMALNTVRPCKKPDVDNVVKVVADALNGIAYHDDTQIVKLIACKYYDTVPRVSVAIYGM